MTTTKTITITISDDAMGEAYIPGEQESDAFYAQYEQNVRALFERQWPDATVELRRGGPCDAGVCGLYADDDEATARELLATAWEWSCENEWLWWTGERLDSLALYGYEHSCGPRVVVDGDVDPELINEIIAPFGWTVGPKVTTNSGAYAYPLVRLTSRHDDGGEPLQQYWYASRLQITRADGSELSATEQAHVRAAIAALGEEDR